MKYHDTSKSKLFKLKKPKRTSVGLQFSFSSGETEKYYFHLELLWQFLTVSKIHLAKAPALSSHGIYARGTVMLTSVHGTCLHALWVVQCPEVRLQLRGSRKT